MAGYRRVNYYELCRLCTSSEGTKMHIFREEGRRRQLPTKIQICLPVQVCEDDSLPKIICSHCVEKLETFYDFRESCVNAEAMLESYFTSIRFSDDFQREGKVYVKEESSSKKQISDGENGTTLLKSSVTTTEGLNSLAQAASIQIVADAGGTRVQQYKCTLQMQPSSAGAAAVESGAAEAHYSYDTCNPSSPRNTDVNTGNTEVTGMGKVEDGSTQCSENDFNSKLNRQHHHHHRSPDSSEQGDICATEHQQHAIAFTAPAPGGASQEMLVQFSVKQDREGFLRVEEQSIAQRSSIAQIGEFLRMKGASVDNSVSSPLAEIVNPSRICNRCGKFFPTIEELHNHSPCSVDDSENLDKLGHSTAGGNFACEICGKPFKRKEHLFQHRKLHTGERPYACTVCGKSFSRKEHLVRHGVSHTGQKMHACDLCGKSFSRKDNLHKHRKTHGIAGPYVCETCGKSFVVKHYFLLHRGSHNTCSSSVSNEEQSIVNHENSMLYKCDVCNKTFAVKQMLVNHKLRHRNKSVNTSQTLNNTSQQQHQHQQNTLQLENSVIEPNPVALTHNTTGLTTINNSVFLTPNILQHVNTSPNGITNTTNSSAATTMIQVSSTAAATAYLCAPGTASDILETYRRLHST